MRYIRDFLFVNVVVGEKPMFMLPVYWIVELNLVIPNSIGDIDGK